ncbi:hypothetical protein C8Q79DRAFT_71407 [Trametes meyenii]|nr:hypothetical protein C8Q79DRAFT_71407 [Trametes meyenii]
MEVRKVSYRPPILSRISCRYWGTILSEPLRSRRNSCRRVVATRRLDRAAGLRHMVWERGRGDCASAAAIATAEDVALACVTVTKYAGPGSTCAGRPQNSIALIRPVRTLPIASSWAR